MQGVDEREKDCGYEIYQPQQMNKKARRDV